MACSSRLEAGLSRVRNVCWGAEEDGRDGNVLCRGVERFLMRRLICSASPPFAPLIFHTVKFGLIDPPLNFLHTCSR